MSNQHNCHILQITESFCAQTLSKIDPKGMCFSVCFPLSLYLGLHGITTTLRSCFYNKQIPHYFLRTDSGLIIDPTIRQFDTSKPAVYIGEVLSEYGDEKEVVLSKIWEGSLYQLYNYGKPKPFPPDIKDTRPPFDINRLLEFSFKASILLQKEIKQFNFHSSLKANQINEYIFALNHAYHIYKQEPGTVRSFLLEMYEPYAD